MFAEKQADKIIYRPKIHTPEALTGQLSILPEHLSVVGSIARCAILGKLKDLERPDGTTTDIDVIDTTCQTHQFDIMKHQPFRVDSGLTKVLRPMDAQCWGLFLPDSEDPEYILDGEFCNPVTIELPWQDGIEINSLPAPIQAELVNIGGEYKKDPVHEKQFIAFCEEKGWVLPADVRKRFNDYRLIKKAWQDNQKQRDRQMYSPGERIYRSMRRYYLDNAPIQFKRFAQRHVAPTVRKLRHTD